MTAGTDQSHFPFPIHEGFRQAKMRVLIIDDCADSAILLSRMLTDSGHSVRVALDSEDGLQVAQEFQPAAVLLDIRLPKMDGYEVARRLRAIQNPPRIIALSGVEVDTQRDRIAGFDHHLVKPVDFDDLLCALRVEQLEEWKQ
jgi:two-component system CheB/CheR fusion protein